jgi:hypothetical protein
MSQEENISSLFKCLPMFAKLGHVEGGQLCGETSSYQVDKRQSSTGKKVVCTVNGLRQE